MKPLKKLEEFKKNFFTINQTELTPFSKLLMTIFFFAALWLIAAGINSSIRQVIPPQQKYGYRCLHFAQNGYLKLSDFDKRRHRVDHQSFGTAPECRTLEDAYQKILNNHRIQSEIVQIELLQNRASHIASQIQKLDQEYSKMLLEKISNQPKEKSILHAHADDVQKKLTVLHKKLRNIKKQIAQKNDIMNYPALQHFVLLVNQTSDTIKNHFAAEKKFYRLKMSAQIFGFVIPIWLLFYLIYKFLTKHKKYIFAQLSFYVASAAALYGLIELIQLIYTIIPKIFLSKIIAFFASHNMIIVLNVLGILLFLLLFGIVIHKVQHNYTKNRAKKDTRVLNVKQGCCFNCGTRREHNDTYCAFCGENLKTTCPECGHEIYRYTLYCNRCGKEQNEPNSENNAT